MAEVLLADKCDGEHNLNQTSEHNQTSIAACQYYVDESDAKVDDPENVKKNSKEI